MANDIVYFVKESEENEELRYSLRSVERNFPHGRIWFLGGCPKDLKPDIWIPINQIQNTKYLRVRDMIYQAIFQEDLSENFYLFNDDFFVMSKVAYTIPTVDGSLAHKIQKIESKYNNTRTNYTRRLRNTANMLRRNGLERLNYELHIPMLINKYQAKVIFETFHDSVAFRSAYGNYYNLARQIHPDVKVLDVDEMYDPDLHNLYLSTSDKTFERGKIGEFIRKTFTEPSRWEISQEKQSV